MSPHDVESVAAQFEAGPRAGLGAAVLRRVRMVDAWRPAELPCDTDEAALRRRARRQGLLLIAGSSALSVFLLYELWSLIRSVV